MSTTPIKIVLFFLIFLLAPLGCNQVETLDVPKAHAPFESNLHTAVEKSVYDEMSLMTSRLLDAYKGGQVQSKEGLQRILENIMSQRAKQTGGDPSQVMALLQKQWAAPRNAEPDLSAYTPQQQTLLYEIQDAFDHLPNRAKFEAVLDDINWRASREIVDENERNQVLAVSASCHAAAAYWLDNGKDIRQQVAQIASTRNPLKKVSVYPLAGDNFRLAQK